MNLWEEDECVMPRVALKLGETFHAHSESSLFLRGQVPPPTFLCCYWKKGSSKEISNGSNTPN